MIQVITIQRTSIYSNHRRECFALTINNNNNNNSKHLNVKVFSFSGTWSFNELLLDYKVEKLACENKHLISVNLAMFSL